MLEIMDDEERNASKKNPDLYELILADLRREEEIIAQEQLQEQMREQEEEETIFQGQDMVDRKSHNPFQGGNCNLGFDYAASLEHIEHPYLHEKEVHSKEEPCPSTSHEMIIPYTASTSDETDCPKEADELFMNEQLCSNMQCCLLPISCSLDSTLRLNTHAYGSDNLGLGLQHMFLNRRVIPKVVFNKPHVAQDIYRPFGSDETIGACESGSSVYHNMDKYVENSISKPRITKTKGKGPGKSKSSDRNTQTDVSKTDYNLYISFR